MVTFAHSFRGVVQVRVYAATSGPVIENAPEAFDAQVRRTGQPPVPSGQFPLASWTLTGPLALQSSFRVPCATLVEASAKLSVAPGRVGTPESWLVTCCATVGAGRSRRAPSAPPPTTRNAAPTSTSHGRIDGRTGSRVEIRFGSGEPEVLPEPKLLQDTQIPRKVSM